MCVCVPSTGCKPDAGDCGAYALSVLRYSFVIKYIKRLFSFLYYGLFDMGCVCTHTCVGLGEYECVHHVVPPVPSDAPCQAAESL